MGQLFIAKKKQKNKTLSTEDRHNQHILLLRLKSEVFLSAVKRLAKGLKTHV